MDDRQEEETDQASRQVENQTGGQADKYIFKQTGRQVGNDSKLIDEKKLRKADRRKVNQTGGEAGRGAR